MEPAVDLNTLLPTIKTVTVNENTDKAEAINIAPFRYKQFTEVSKHIVLIRANVKTDGDVDLLKLVSEHGAEIGEIVRIACKKDQAWMDELELTDVLALVAAVLEVNRDFFSQRLAPMLRDLAARLANGVK